MDILFFFGISTYILQFAVKKSVRNTQDNTSSAIKNDHRTSHLSDAVRNRLVQGSRQQNPPASLILNFSHFHPCNRCHQRPEISPTSGRGRSLFTTPMKIRLSLIFLVSTKKDAVAFDIEPTNHPLYLYLSESTSRK